MELVPLPQEPVGPHSASVWHTKPCLHVPLVAPVPLPQVPWGPQFASVWQVMLSHVLPPQAPPLQSPLSTQVHAPFVQVRPVPHSLSFVHTVGWQVPVAAPLQL